MVTTVADRDALSQKARTELAAGRIDSAIDCYKGLADTGDWRGYEGLLNVIANAGKANPNWSGHLEYPTSVAKRYEGRFAKPEILRALYPVGFSITGTIESMESAFGSYEGCRPLIGAAKDAAYNHPYVAIEAVAAAANFRGSKGANKEREREFVYAFAGALGASKETTTNLLQHMGFFGDQDSA